MLYVCWVYGRAFQPKSTISKILTPLMEAGFQPLYLPLLKTHGFGVLLLAELSHFLIVVQPLAQVCGAQVEQQVRTQKESVPQYKALPSV